ncbi:L1Tco protein [Diplonema papillatum]|nr:L1Tco protein [Diplonema papillatum]
MPAEKFDHPFARIAWTWERNKTWGLPTFYALVAWLSDMQWTENGQVSMLELAIDFELFSGLSMPLHGNAPKGVRERGNVLRCMMSALDKLAAQQGLGSCMRGERVCPTTSLSFMGITGISGIRPRPRFREAHTGTILEEQVKGSDVGTQCPTYPDWTIGRAARWALPAPPQLHPDPVHMPGVGIEKALVTCATHHKGKCEACRALVRRDVPTVEMCCRHHHHANDGQPIAVCTEHSTSLVFLRQHLAPTPCPLHILVLSDSQSFLKTLSAGPHSQVEPLAIECWTNLSELEAKGYLVTLHFVYGHCGLEGNDAADVLAKAAALEWEPLPRITPSPTR